MATTLDGKGMAVQEFSGPLRRRIESLLPGHASARNPVDLTFHTDMSNLVEDLPRMLLEADEVDGLLIHGIMGTGWTEIAHPLLSRLLDISMEDFSAMLNVDLDPLVGLARKSGKPVLASSFFGREDSALRAFHEAGIPCFDSPEKAAAAMAWLYRSHVIATRTPDAPQLPESPPDEALAVLGRIGAEGPDEFDAKALLRAYGISTCREKRVTDAQEAVAAAEAIGYPVAVKGCSPRVAHKSEAGLVHLNLADADQVAAACRAIDLALPGTPLLVCEMLSGDREVMAGITRPPGFGPCVVFGLGGIFTEVFHDVAVRLAPFGPVEAEAAIGSIRSRGILDAFRGRPAADTPALADLLVRLGHLACHFPEIREMDLNPILLCEGTPRVADALLVV